jgi:anaerobic ribonucleoside-triphosphate reductase activating protein
MGKSVWAYSGWTFEELLLDEKKRALLEACDVLVDGRFILERRSLALRFRGSDNQRVIDVPASLKEGKVVLWQDPWDALLP